jgi:hypothetical protein
MNALDLATQIIMAAAGDPKRSAEAAELIDDFAADAVRRERQRLGNCPECGSTDFVYADEGDYDRTCHECRYVG